MRRLVFAALMASVASAAMGTELPVASPRSAAVADQYYQPQLRIVPACYEGRPGLLNCAPRAAEEECPAASPYCYETAKRRYRPYIQMFSWGG